MRIRTHLAPDGHGPSTAEGRPEAAGLVEVLHNQGIPRGVILDAFRYVPRDVFVPVDRRRAAWENRPIEIGHGQTISQPYTIAYMLRLADVSSSDRVLEVGAGSGYVLALLAYIVGDPRLVTGIEYRKSLSEHARTNLTSLGLDRVTVVHGDGRDGYPSKAPFDAIIVSAQADEVPQALVDQLAVDGTLVIPVNVGSYAALTRVTKGPNGVTHTRHGAFQFVPLK